MLTYPEILKETLNLNPDEQKQLLEELTKVINQQTNPTKNLDKWFGFLPKRIEPMEFQLEIRKEWERDINPVDFKLKIRKEGNREHE